MIKKLLLLTTLMFINFANGEDIKLYFKNSEITNAQTALLYLDAKNIKEPKLTVLNKEKTNIDFFKNPFKKNNFYALIPISYYKDIKPYKIIVSYKKNNQKEFKSTSLILKNGKYKSEVINVKSSKVSLSKKNQQRTKKEYKEAMDIYNSVTTKLLWNSDFIYPLNTKITSEFGTKRVYNNKIKSYHSGTDFRASIGTPIKAANDGIVVLAKHRFYAGNSIIIDHGHGVYTCYYHLSKMNFKKNQKVKKGEIIGLSGNTGRVTGPHLHFSARVNSIQVDPMQLITILNKMNN